MFSVCAMRRKERWHSFLRLCQGLRDCCLPVTLAILHYLCVRRQPDIEHLAELLKGWKNQICKNKVSHCSCGKGLTFELNIDTLQWCILQDYRMDADRIGQPWGYQVIEATHEWMWSITHSTPSLLLFIPTVLSPSPPYFPIIRIRKEYYLKQLSVPY